MKHLWGNGFVSEFHADFTDTILWAEASCESGKLASPDFHYVYFIPFGGNLLMNAFIPFFGVGITAIRCAMTVAILIMCAVAIAFFKTLVHDRARAVTASAIIFCLLCSTVKLREVFFSHVIHYSLAVGFLMLTLTLCGSAGESNSPVRKLLFGAVLTWAASCGPTMLLYVAMPILGSLVVWRILDATALQSTVRRDVSWLCAGIAGVLAGIMIHAWLSAGIPPTSYSDAYERFCSPLSWQPYIERLPRQWLTLFFDPPGEAMKIATIKGLRIAMRIICGICIAILPALACLKYKAFDNRAQILLITHWLLAAGILFYWQFGSISNSNWRLSPLIVTGAAVSICLMEALRKDRMVQLRRIAAMTTAAAVLYSAYLPLSMALKRENTDIWFGEGTLIPTLEKLGVTYGYCCDFWFSNSTTVLTGGKIKLREVNPAKSTGWKRKQYQSADHWYIPRPGCDKTALVCYKHQERLAPRERLIARHTCRQRNLRLGSTVDFVVLVYDGDFPQALDH